MLSGYELTLEDTETIELICSECGCLFEELRWQFEIDVEGEGEDYFPLCPSCCGEEDLS